MAQNPELERYQAELEHMVQRGLNTKDSKGISGHFYAAIGMLATEWAYVEDCSAMLLGILFDLSYPKTMMMTANLGMQSRIHLLGALVHAAKRARLSSESRMINNEIEQIIKEIGEILPLRNQYIHSVYLSGIGEDGAEMIIHRVKGRLRVGVKRIRASEIYVIYLRAKQLALKILTVIKLLDPDDEFLGKDGHRALPEEVCAQMTLEIPAQNPTSSRPPPHNRRDTPD